MKKTQFLAVALTAMCLISCDSTNNNNNSDKQNVNAEQVEVTTEKKTDSKAETSATIAVPQNMTGDMEKDAENLVKATLDMSAKMTTGKDNNADAQKVQQAMEAAKEYYGKQGKTKEFVKIVNEKMAKGVAELASKMKAENAK